MDVFFETPCGRLRGEKKDGMDIVRGVRYASAGRWEDPEPVEKWDGVFDGTKEAPACVQKAAFYEPEGPDRFFADSIKDQPETGYSEDCLYLKIWTPDGAAGKKEKLPVILFVFGGSFENGTISSPEFDGREYCRRGIILAAAGYRLNAFGNGPEKSSGDLCLKDITAALRWIKRNIASLGGDPDDITLMGESAGAVIIQDLMFAPLARGLFRKAVMLSSGGVMPERQKMIMQDDAEKLWDAAAATAGTDTGGLRKLPAKQIFDLYEDLKNDPAMSRAARPYVDGAFIPDTPEELMKKDAYTSVPCLINMLSHDMFPLQLHDAACEWGRFQAERGHAPVYCSISDFTPGGAKHGTDLCYVFGTFEHIKRDFEKRDIDLSERMINRIAEFVKTGALSDWEPVSAGSRRFMHIGYSGENMADADRDELKRIQDEEPPFPGM
ncbi:MAG: carboxylesterase family protein [Anaerovoracaceae bacterium]